MSNKTKTSSFTINNLYTVWATDRNGSYGHCMTRQGIIILHLQANMASAKIIHDKKVYILWLDGEQSKSALLRKGKKWAREIRKG